MNANLKYASWNGTAWATNTVDSEDGVGHYTSLAFDPTGAPHISHYDATNHELKYTSWNGTVWETSTVDRSGDVGRYTSLAFDASGYPTSVIMIVLTLP
ncbi:hypothetical protein [Methanogenium cariaci]|uniref:hypothetical protein n=1 Tax=Methanogenium cariaci TaxID=2197 RepID=UPI000780A00F|nr:hypothetical protein [Methanogenium cariaci]